MYRWVGSVALASGLAVLTATGPASADVVYIGPGGALSEPVPLYLQMKEQRSELRIYRRSDQLDLVAPLVVCTGNCAFKLLPGPYRLQLKGPPDSDIESGSRVFDLRGPSSVYVDPPSSTARWVGLGMGVLGPTMIILGVALLAEANTAIVEGGPSRDSTKEFAGGALAVGGVMLTVGGWIMFAANGKPHLTLRPLVAQAPGAEPAAPNPIVHVAPAAPAPAAPARAPAASPLPPAPPAPAAAPAPAVTPAPAAPPLPPAPPAPAAAPGGF